MSWLFSRALVAEYSGGSSSGGEPFAQLNVMPTPAPFWRNGKTMEPSRFSQFGLTYAPLTEDLGAAVLTWCLEASPVRTSARPDVAPESRESNPPFGWKWPGSFVKYDPDSRSWRTRQCSLLGGLTAFSETWPKWGWMRDGECSELTMPAHLTNESASGFWPTPAANEYEASAEKTLARRAKLKAKHMNGNGFGLTVGQAVHLWATPGAGDHKGGPGLGCRARGGHQSSLPTMAKSWGHGEECASSPAATEQRATLSPDFHLWLMGWPEGWNALEPLEMDKYQRWLRSHGAS